MGCPKSAATLRPKSTTSPLRLPSMRVGHWSYPRRSDSGHTWDGGTKIGALDRKRPVDRAALPRPFDPRRRPTAQVVERLRGAGIRDPLRPETYFAEDGRKVPS